MWEWERFSYKRQTAAVDCVLVYMQGQRSLLDTPTPPQLDFVPFLDQLVGWLSLAQLPFSLLSGWSG